MTHTVENRSFTTASAKAVKLPSKTQGIPALNVGY
jgi:hypothetical protein